MSSGGDAYSVSAFQNHHRQAQPRTVRCCWGRLPERRTAVQRVRPENEFYNKKKELVHAEIMLPSYTPPGYADRATLWNAVEAVENQWNSQLARRIVLAFPVEVPKERYLSMIKEFCQEQFCFKRDDCRLCHPRQGRWKPTRPHSADAPGNG